MPRGLEQRLRSLPCIVLSLPGCGWRSGWMRSQQLIPAGVRGRHWAGGILVVLCTPVPTLTHLQWSGWWRRFVFCGARYEGPRPRGCMELSPGQPRVSQVLQGPGGQSCRWACQEPKPGGWAARPTLWPWRRRGSACLAGVPECNPLRPGHCWPWIKSGLGPKKGGGVVFPCNLGHWNIHWVLSRLSEGACWVSFVVRNRDLGLQLPWLL